MGNSTSRQEVKLFSTSVSVGTKKDIQVFSLSNSKSSENSIKVVCDGEGGTVGFRIWPGSLVLADFLVNQRPDLVQNKEVIELGCGVGVVGLSVAKFCKPESVVLTDRETVRRVVEEGIEINQAFNCNVEFKNFDWGSGDDLNRFSSSSCKGQRVVIGSELVYAEEQEPLCNAVDAVVDDMFILAYTQRTDIDKAYFDREILGKRFNLVERFGDVYVLNKKIVI